MEEDSTFTIYSVEEIYDPETGESDEVFCDPDFQVANQFAQRWAKTGDYPTAVYRNEYIAESDFPGNPEYSWFESWHKAGV